MSSSPRISRPIAVHFGAGNIGRGFIGPLLSSTHHVIFVDIQEDIINAINTDKQYVVRVVGAGRMEKQTISDIEAVSTNSPETTRALLEADIITTSVGPEVLSKIAPAIAKGLTARAKADKGTINVIACENLLGATSRLREFVEEELGDSDKAVLEYVNQSVGFANCTVDRIVPPFESESVLDVAVEEYSEWIVDRTALKDPVPHVEGMKLADSLDAYVERKLFTLNTAHAFLAYTGYLKGHKTINQSLNDPQLRTMVEGAIKESGIALIKKYDLNPAHHAQYVVKILNRLALPELDDDLCRIGRCPLRKLRKDDRLVAPVNMAREFGLPRNHLLLGMAAALLFDYPEDGEAMEMQETIKEKGIENTVKEVTGLDEGCDDYQTVLKAYQELDEFKRSRVLRSEEDN